MPCCEWVLSVAASSRGTTPSWLHRLHAKGGLSFPANLHIDDLLYGQPQLPPPRPLPLPPPPPPPPPPSSSDHYHHRQHNPQDPPPKPKPPRTPSWPNPSGSNNNPPQPQPQPQPQPHPQPPPLAYVFSDVFAVPCAELSTRPLLKPFRKQSRPRPRPDDKSPPPPHKDAMAKAKARKRRRAERDADGERRTRTEVTVIDTSIDGWKAAKLLLRRGAVWKVRDNKNPRISEPEDLSKGKRRAGLVSKIQRDKEKGKDAALPGNVGASSGDVMKLLDGPVEMLERSRWFGAVPEELGQRTEVHLQSTSTFSQPAHP